MPKFCASIADMIGAGLRCTAYCASCYSSKEVDLQAVAAKKGMGFCLWNRRARCRISEGCTGRCGFYYDNADGRAEPMWDFQVRRDEHGVRIATTAFEAAMWHKGIKVTCRCMHHGVHDPHGLWWLCERRDWSDRFQDLAKRFYCLKCFFGQRRKVRPIRVEATLDDATITLPMPSEQQWKRALKRVRS